MDSNAPGQFLGYTLQIPRALFHLLDAGPGDVVCVEVLGDVATLRANSQLIAEEDKSSTTGNPLANRSTDFWKTLYNWIVAIHAGEIDVRKTRFILYSNKSGRPGIVDTFHNANNSEEATNAITDAKRTLADLDEDHDIWKFYDFVVNKHRNHLVEVIQRFEFQLGEGAGYDEVKDALKRKYFSDNEIELLLERLSGWLQKELTELIAANQPAIVEWDTFRTQTKVIFERVRYAELIDFTQGNAIADSEIQIQVKNRPTYLKQLEVINCDMDEEFEAASDYLRAEVNRLKWIENEIIDEHVAADFQAKLVAFWKNQKRRIAIAEQGRGQDDQGHLLLLVCKDRQETMRNMSPPAGTVAGTYHALADEPILGWHPNWESSFKNKDE